MDLEIYKEEDQEENENEDIGLFTGFEIQKYQMSNQQESDSITDKDGKKQQSNQDFYTYGFSAFQDEIDN